MPDNRAIRSSARGTRSQSRSPSQAAASSPSRQPAQRALSRTRIDGLLEIGRNHGRAQAKESLTPDGRTAMITWINTTTHLAAGDKPYIKEGAIEAFDEAKQLAGKPVFDRGVSFGRSWALSHALSGTTLNDQRTTLGAEVQQRKRTYRGDYKQVFEQGVRARFDSAKNSMHRTVPRSWSV